MSFTKKTMTALRGWLAVETCFSDHDLDNERFYKFIYEVWSEKKSFWDEGEAREAILDMTTKFHPTFDKETIEKSIQEMHSKGSTILDFLSFAKDKNLL